MSKYEYNEQKEFIRCNREYKVDIPVLLIFFNRPDKLEQVFQQIKKARPSKLYLYQDGVRVGNLHDQQSVLKCREVVSNIDWDCEVHRLYQEKFLVVIHQNILHKNGCFPRNKKVLSWKMMMYQL